MPRSSGVSCPSHPGVCVSRCQMATSRVAAGSCTANSGQVPADRGVEVELALFHQPHDRGRGDGLRDRRDRKDRVGRQRLRIVDVGDAEPARRQPAVLHTPNATPGTPYSVIFCVTSAASCSNFGSGVAAASWRPGSGARVRISRRRRTVSRTRIACRHSTSAVRRVRRRQGSRMVGAARAKYLLADLPVNVLELRIEPRAARLAVTEHQNCADARIIVRVQEDRELQVRKRVRIRPGPVPIVGHHDEHDLLVCWDPALDLVKEMIEIGDARGNLASG